MEWTERLPAITPRALSVRLRREGVDLWLCSHGGCATNAVSEYLEYAGLRIRSQTWMDYGCHAPEPFFQPSLPTVYLTAYDLLPCIRSQYHRRLLLMNLTKMHGYEHYPVFDPVTLNGLDLTILKQQRDMWIEHASFVLYYETLPLSLSIVLRYFRLQASPFVMAHRTAPMMPVAAETMTVRTLTDQGLYKAVSPL